MELFIQFVVNGIALGGIYALMSLGFAVIYNTVRIFHVLHGAVFVVAGYVTWALLQSGMPIVFAACLAVVCATFLGMGIELAVYRPLRQRGAGFLAAFLASLAGMFFFEGLMVAVFSTTLKVLKTGPLNTFQIGDVYVTYFNILTIALVVVLFTLVTLFLTYARYGRMIRAVASNPDLAVAVGIKASQVYIMVFALGSALAGIGGIMRSYDIGLEPVIGLPLAITAAVGVIIGGIGSLPGAAVGGMALGLAQTLAALFAGGQWGQPVAFALLLLVIVFRPYGLLGSREHRELRRLL